MENTHKLKKKLLKERGTENFHLALEELQPDVARKVVESLTPDEIYVKVNHRTFEEDYICDYIDYLWDISSKAFWRHVYHVLDEEEGILFGGDMIYFGRMCDNLVPKKILFKLIYLYSNRNNDNFNIDEMGVAAIGCVLRAQTKKFDRWKTIKKHLRSNYSNHKILKKEIKKLTKTKCTYYFGF
ncbi:hypothetical protein [Lacinutrix salivirga]